jgi:hypothetical protein
MYQCAAEARAARALASSLLFAGICVPWAVCWFQKWRHPSSNRLASHVAALAPERSNENR